MGYLPEHLKDQTKAATRAAFWLPEKVRMVRLEKQAEWLEREYPSAAASLREGLAEMFTVSRLGLSSSLSRSHLDFLVLRIPHTKALVRREGRSALRPGDEPRACRVDRPPALFSQAEENLRPRGNGQPAFASSTGEGSGSGSQNHSLTPGGGDEQA